MSEAKKRLIEYRKDNKSRLKLTDEQCDLHYEVMSMSMNEWPDSLSAYIQEQTIAYGCNDEDDISSWVADWVREGNKILDPFDGESEEEEEAGVQQALATLAALKKVEK